MKFSKQGMEQDYIQAFSVGTTLLNSVEQKWINAHYLRNNPEYKSIVKEYENDKARNKKLKCP